MRQLWLLVALNPQFPNLQTLLTRVQIIAPVSVVLGAWFVLHVRSQLGPAIRSYWEMGYLPLSSFAAGWDFLIRNGWSAVSGALPLRCSLLAVLAIPGMTWLMAGKTRRAVGAIVLVAVLAP